MSSRADSIFRQYSAALRGFIKKQLSSDSVESEDILHDLFYKFLITDGENEQVDNVTSWLYRVARNLIIDRSRKKKEEPMPQVEGDEQSLIPISELLLRNDITPEDELSQLILEEEFERALASLPTEQRTVYELNELQGIPYTEISAATNIPINTLISRKRYATQSLRQQLQHLLD